MRRRSADARSTRVGLARVGGKVRLSVSFLPGGSTPLQRKGNESERQRDGNTPLGGLPSPRGTRERVGAGGVGYLLLI